MLMSEGLALTISKLVPYSLGVVAQNKVLSSKEIEVTPIEEVPFVDGELTATPNTATATATNADGGTYTSTTATAVTIKARWLPISVTNRMTAPDVRRGEYVMIYRYAEADTFYWTTLKDDMSLRKLETVVWGWSGTPDENVVNGPSNMYFFEVSTHRKVVHFHTSKANGEPYTYDLQLDTATGKFTFTDDIGNYIFLDSAEHRIVLHNTDGSTYDMHRENLTMTIPKTTKLICTDFLVEASNKMDVRATNNFSVTTSNSSIDASASASMKASTTTVTGDSSLICKGAGAGLSASGGNAQMTAPSSAMVQSSATVII